jgi:DNA-binding CsgD family transcriptional regulator
VVLSPAIPEWSRLIAEIDVRAANSQDGAAGPPAGSLDESSDWLRAADDATRSVLAAIDLLLESIAGPALLISRSGAILKTSASARGLPSQEPRKTSSTAPDVGLAWHLTAIHVGGEAIGYLAVPSAPRPVEPPLHDELEAVRARWRLTERQASVLELVARGYPNDLIAETLGIAKGTVEHHVSRVLDKAGAFSRASLILRMLEVGRRSAG